MVRSVDLESKIDVENDEEIPSELNMEEIFSYTTNTLNQFGDKIGKAIVEAAFNRNEQDN